MSAVISLDIARTAGDFGLKVAFDLGPGISALFGPSGAGKTMILEAIAGLARPDTGKITLGGRTLFDSESRTSLPPEKRRIGYVFQHGRLFPHLSVEQNLLYGLRFIPEGTRHADLTQIVEILGLRHLLDRRTHALSGGESQRVAIGRALVTSPELLLMDEPLASLDPARRLEILPFIEELSESFSLPVIYVTHAMDEIIRLAETAVMIDKGHVVARGEAESVLNRHELRPLFGMMDPAAPGAPLAILTCKLAEHDRAFGLSRITAQGLSFWLPNLDRPIGSRMRLQVRATDVSLARSEPDDTSILNRFHGTIETIEDRDLGYVDVEIRMATGPALWARVTKKSAVRLELETGHDIWCLVKSVAVARGTAMPLAETRES